jgi:hypothetical protein
MERVGEHVRRELERFGAAGSMTDLIAAWPAAVGEMVAANAWPARFARDGTLHVATSSSAWAFELTQLAAEVVASLRSELGEKTPSRLRFAPGPLPEPDPAAQGEERREPLEPTLEHVREANVLAAGIESEELRKTVEKAARASLARASARRGVW